MERLVTWLLIIVVLVLLLVQLGEHEDMRARQSAAPHTQERSAP